jgi:hypothetical protein
VSLLNEYARPGCAPTDTEYVELLKVAAEQLQLDDHYRAGVHVKAAAERLDLRSRQLNHVLYRIAAAAGFDDHDGRIEANPEDIVARVEALLRPADPSAPIDGKASTVAPETAHEAARRREHRLAWGNDRTAILAHLGGLNPGRGCTAAELAAVFGWSRNQTAARLLELREMGLVDYLRTEDGATVTRATGPGARGRVQRITGLGERALTNLSVASG